MLYAVDQGYYSNELIDSSFLERVQQKFKCVEMDTDHSGCGKEAMRGRHPQFQPQWRRFVWCECRGWRLPASPPHWKPRMPPSAPLLLPYLTSLRGFQEFYLQPTLHYTAFQSTISVDFEIRIESQMVIEEVSVRSRSSRHHDSTKSHRAPEFLVTPKSETKTLGFWNSRVLGFQMLASKLKACKDWLKMGLLHNCATCAPAIFHVDNNSNT
jgi:hypothetical protein